MNQKGFVNIALIILVVVTLAVVVAVGYFAFVKNSEVAKKPQLSSETEKPFVLIGKRQTGSSADLYKGYVIVEGEYSVDYSDSILGGGTLYFTVDEQYRSKLPKRYDEYPQGFIFDNESSAKQMLDIHDGDKSICSISGEARIAIEDYTTELLESEVFDHTKFANVLSHTSPTVEKCKELSPAPQSPGWKTYSSDLMGIGLKYPPTYYVVKNFGNPGSDTFTSVTYLGKESDRSSWGKEVGGTPAHIQIIYHANRRNLSIADLAKEWANSAGVTSSCKNLTVVGENALRCSLYVEGEAGLYSDMIFLKHSSATYSFAADSPTANDIVHSDLLKILETLKFFQ